jgi:hypothetical protein
MEPSRQVREILVECYSGHTFAQEPRAVVTARGLRCPVVEVEQRWRTPEGPSFRVRTEAGDRLELHYSELEDRWSVGVLQHGEHVAAPCE